MDKQSDKKRQISRVKKGSTPFIYLIPILIISFLVGLYLYSKNTPTNNVLLHEDAPTVVSADAVKHNFPIKKNDLVADLHKTQQKEHSTLSLHDNTFSHVDKVPPSEDVLSSTPYPIPADQTVTPADIVSAIEPPANEKCLPLIKDINEYYARLDQQQYMRDFHLTTTSKIHFSKLLQKLVDNPPVVTRETDDLFTLLKNTAHFFRILGKGNILVLKGLLDREKDSLEQILQTFYSLSFHPHCLEKEYSLTLPLDALYDYAGFFLNTMGGRLYLFRRDSTSRMVVSYYAILIIDRANSEGNDRHGIYLLPAIDSLIEGIENGGKRLQHREEFLDILYDLKEKYSR